MNLEATSLQNAFVRLEPLAAKHIDGLWEASTPEIWQYMPIRVEQKSDIRRFVDFAEKVQANGEGLPFAVIDPESGTVIGATGFWNYVAEHKRVEIGFTWYTPNRQRTAINTACKLLLLSYSFQVLDLNRVEFKTDSLNQKSRKAIARIGAVEEGVLRAHVVQPDGRLRHSVYFSILKEEWPAVEQRLTEFLSR